jgi:hypothetical protein
MKQKLTEIQIRMRYDAGHEIRAQRQKQWDCMTNGLITAAENKRRSQRRRIAFNRLATMLETIPSLAFDIPRLDPHSIEDRVTLYTLTAEYIHRLDRLTVRKWRHVFIKADELTFTRWGWGYPSYTR